jgi:hypothetical protein
MRKECKYNDGLQCTKKKCALEQFFIYESMHGGSKKPVSKEEKPQRRRRVNQPDKSLRSGRYHEQSAYASLVSRTKTAGNLCAEQERLNRTIDVIATEKDQKGHLY